MTELKVEIDNDKVTGGDIDTPISIIEGKGDKNNLSGNGSFKFGVKQWYPCILWPLPPECGQDL